MRLRLLPLVFLFCACGDEPPPSHDGKDAEAWAAALEDEATLMQAQEELVRGGANALPVLIAILESEHRKARLVAGGILLNLGAEAAPAAPALVAALENEDPSFRGMAAVALGAIGKSIAPRAGPPLARALEDSDARVRASAAHALIRLGHTPESILPTLLADLADGDAGARAVSRESFRAIGEPAIDPLVEAMTGTEDPLIRARAAESLGALEAKAARARPALEELQWEQSALVRAAAKDALARIPR